ncbi:MAG: NAD+ synthase, partial [Candidatus Omnitrophica bacterium]|nr:NAD+ synthase [Candidatus Omnitrophota bacterium]
MVPLRLALAQLNVTVGDLDGNRRLVEEAIRQAQAWLADLVVVPELAVTGYPPEDLLLKPQFVEANLRTLARLAPWTRGLVALVGYVDRDRRGRLFNAAAVLAEGRHVATYRKQFLPNYGVFDEKRYFTPGTDSLIMEAQGCRLGVTICEDVWEEQPIRALAAAGARLVVNLSASPYHAGKLKERERLFALRARRNRVAIAYCNLVGGQDELVFDGASLVLDARGRLISQGAQFREDFLVV